MLSLSSRFPVVIFHMRTDHTELHSEELVEKFAVILKCTKGLAGQEVFRFKVRRSDNLFTFLKIIAHELKVSLYRLRVLLPAGKLLSTVDEENRKASVEEVLAHIRKVTGEKRDTQHP